MDVQAMRGGAPQHGPTGGADPGGPPRPEKSRFRAGGGLGGKQKTGWLLTNQNCFTVGSRRFGPLRKKRAIRCPPRVCPAIVLLVSVIGKNASTRCGLSSGTARTFQQGRGRRRDARVAGAGAGRLIAVRCQAMTVNGFQKSLKTARNGVGDPPNASGWTAKNGQKPGNPSWPARGGRRSGGDPLPRKEAIPARGGRPPSDRPKPQTKGEDPGKIDGKNLVFQSAGRACVQKKRLAGPDS